MPHLLAPRTYLVLAVACLLGFGGGALLVAVDSPVILFYLLGVLLVGLYTMQALKPGVGLRPLRKGTTEPERDESVLPTEETEGRRTAGAEPATRREPATGPECTIEGKHTTGPVTIEGKHTTRDEAALGGKVTTGAEPSTGAEHSMEAGLPTRGAFSTINYGRAGGFLDPTEKLERARKTIWVEADHRGGSVPLEQEVGHGRGVSA
jgi:hypothetical protein